MKFGVTLYSPEAAGESGCQALLEQVAQALMERGPAGFAVEKWSAGETAFDQASGMFWGRSRRCAGACWWQEWRRAENWRALR